MSFALCVGRACEPGHIFRLVSSEAFVPPALACQCSPFDRITSDHLCLTYNVAWFCPCRDVICMSSVHSMQEREETGEGNKVTLSKEAPLAANEATGGIKVLLMASLMLWLLG